MLTAVVGRSLVSSCMADTVSAGWSAFLRAISCNMRIPRLPARRPQPLTQCEWRQRPADEIPLGDIAAHSGEQIPGLLILHSFGDDLQAQVVRQSHRRADD